MQTTNKNHFFLFERNRTSSFLSRDTLRNRFLVRLGRNLQSKGCWACLCSLDIQVLKGNTMANITMIIPSLSGVRTPRSAIGIQAPRTVLWLSSVMQIVSATWRLMQREKRNFSESRYYHTHSFPFLFVNWISSCLCLSDVKRRQFLPPVRPSPLGPTRNLHSCLLLFSYKHSDTYETNGDWCNSTLCCNLLLIAFVNATVKYSLTGE